MEDYKRHLIKSLCDAYKNTHKGVFQEDLAKLIDISKSTLDKACAGEFIPAIDTLYKVAKFFGLTLNDFFESFNSIQTVKEPEPRYMTNDIDGWKEAVKAQNALIELQKEYTELAVELERTKKDYALKGIANAG